MAGNGEELTAQESRKAARRMLERIENTKEIADALYAWNARALANSQCMLLPGDLCVCGKDGIQSSRGVMIQMSPEEIAGLIEGGALDKIFDVDGLNAPDFSTRMEDVFTAFVSQQHFCDADRYRASGDMSRAVAVYDPPVPEGEPRSPVAVERDGDRFRLVAGFHDDGGTGQECDYSKFNPGRADIMSELADSAGENQNRGSAYQELQEKYLADGKNDAPKMGDLQKPEDVPGYDKMSPMAQLRLQADYVDAMDAVRQEEQAQAEEDGMEPMPGRRGPRI